MLLIQLVCITVGRSAAEPKLSLDAHFKLHQPAEPTC